MIIGPCTTNAVEQFGASLHIERAFIGARPYKWIAVLTLPGEEPFSAAGSDLQKALDVLEAFYASRREHPVSPT